MAVNDNQEEVKSRREKFIGGRMKEKYPDREFADDEELFGQIDDDYAGYEKRLGEYKGREESLMKLFEKDPRNAEFIADMAKGRDPWIAVIERLGIDGVTDLINDPEKQEVYAEANKKYVEKLAKEKDLEETYQKNLAESMKLVERVQTERGISDETMDAAMDLVIKMASEAILGTFTEQTVDMALKAVGYDAAVTNARTEGQVAGRNARIQEQLRKPNGGDGQPNLSGSNNAPTRKPSNMSMFDLADEAR